MNQQQKGGQRLDRSAAPLITFNQRFLCKLAPRFFLFFLSAVSPTVTKNAVDTAAQTCISGTEGNGVVGFEVDGGGSVDPLWFEVVG
jgi:hypothetical protein